MFFLYRWIPGIVPFDYTMGLSGFQNQLDIYYLITFIWFKRIFQRKN